MNYDVNYASVEKKNHLLVVRFSSMFIDINVICFILKYNNRSSSSTIITQMSAAPLSFRVSVCAISIFSLIVTQNWNSERKIYVHK